MTKERQRSVHLRLLDKALLVWERQFPAGSVCRYRESVAGTVQLLDVRLPREAFKAIQDGRDLANIETRYLEPITGLQDGDLKLPDNALFAYYAVYNAFRLHVAGETLDPWIIVKQSLSALGNDDAEAALQAALDA